LVTTGCRRKLFRTNDLQAWNGCIKCFGPSPILFFIVISCFFVLSLSPTDKVFVLTGAGISAESGIPTFRGVGGLWRNYHIEEVASPHAWRRDPQLVWEFYSMRRRVAAEARPNPGHVALAKLEQSLGDRLSLCTQNVDSLHEHAGSQRVIHMHGELFKSRCDTCSRPPFDDTKTYEPPSALPLCDTVGRQGEEGSERLGGQCPGHCPGQCPGMIRPHICWFGEVPYDLDRIFGALNHCTVFIAVGTSGVVEPAASFAAHVRRRARTIYVGPEDPANRDSFSEVCVGTAAEALPGLFGA
jgi:NAD-dependent deacetylase